MGEGRSEGLHWSQVTGALAEMERGRPYKEIKGEQEGVRMALGFILETFIEHAFKVWMSASRRRRVVTQTELSVPTPGGPIFMTLDGIDYDSDPDGPVVEEYKATWRSMRKLGSTGWSDMQDLSDQDLATVRDGLEAEFWEWLVRIKGYCRAVGTRKARLVVLFVNGDYSWRPGHGPQIRQFDLEFTEQEIQENWVMGERMAARIRREAGEEYV